MNIFLAARYPKRGEMITRAADLTALGHTIVSSWIYIDNDLLDTQIRDTADRDPLIATRAGEIALKQIHEVMHCDLFIAFTEKAAEGWRGGGRHVELGVALAAREIHEYDEEPRRDGPRIMIVGPRENLFCNIPHIPVFASWFEALKAIGPSPLVARQ